MRPGRIFRARLEKQTMFNNSTCIEERHKITAGKTIFQKSRMNQCLNGAPTIRPKTVQPIGNSDNSARNIQTIQPGTFQPVLQNARFERKKSRNLSFFSV